MDDTELSRLKVPTEDLSSQTPTGVDGISIEDGEYPNLREALEADSQDFHSPTWSLAVDPLYVKRFSKEAVERQDTIHELIQTEINHVRTLKLMLYVYAYEIQCSVPKEEVQLERLFPRLDHLLREHQNFLDRLKLRRRECLEPDSQQNYCISRVGDLLIAQFSDEPRSRLLDSYGVFCSCHTDAMSYYKDLLQNNKKFQSLIRKIGQFSIVRRLGVPEGFLLITQRITKYPFLVERLIKNTEAGSEEHSDLVSALERIKDTISQVDEQVHRYEKLRELASRLEPKSQGRMSNGQVLRREDLLQHGRRVLKEGFLSWRTQNRTKVSDVFLVLLSDLLLLLQEKDQKLVFASLDGKPAVLSLQRMIVRDAAQSEKIMYLISTSDENADMYVFYASSGEESRGWRESIWQAIESFPYVYEEEEEDPLDQEELFSEKIKAFHDQLCISDAQIVLLLQNRLKVFSEMVDTLMDSSSPPRRLLLTGTSSDLQQGAILVKGIIADAEVLQCLLLAADDVLVSVDSVDKGLASRRANTIAGYTKAGSGSQDGFRNQRPNSDPQLRDLYLDNHELSADDEQWTYPRPAHVPRNQLLDTLAKLTQKLYTLQAVVCEQESESELLRAALAERPARLRGNGLLAQEKQRHLEKQREELLRLQRVYNQQKEEQAAWEQERQCHLQEREELQREKQKLAAERQEFSRCREQYQQDLERLREATRAVDRQREQLEQKEQQLSKYKKHSTISNHGAGVLQEHTQEGHLTVDDMFLPLKFRIRPTVSETNFQERPPVPPRKESMGISPVKADVPIQLVSTTNQTLKPSSSSVQQQIPTKLAKSKGKEKERGRTKSSHQRTNSAASIEVSSVVPIKVGKGGGSLRAPGSRSPRHLPPEFYTSPEHVLNMKTQTHAANAHTVRKPSQSHNHKPNRNLSPNPSHNLNPNLSHPNQKVKDNSSSENVFYC
ncbi:rho guanine nucleotide exchange factor 18a [Hoplias malabaricus]|uniref:rho guanine nucleotide exchange factor 18a n=1 Tax=Hoplias malabaricus TaxID=27720 RepID=UPI0034621F3D